MHVLEVSYFLGTKNSFNSHQIRAKKLNYDIPNFDFIVEGVTSISLDIHKYGYGAKGASVIVYRNENYRKYQFFVYGEWPGGLFISPTGAGTRPGAQIASAWAALNFWGQDGYLKLAEQVLKTADYLRENIPKVEGLRILGT